MAKNTGEGWRIGSVRNWSQTYNPQNDTWMKRDTDTGRFMDGKDIPHKGVAKGPDKRRK